MISEINTNQNLEGSQSYDVNKISDEETEKECGENLWKTNNTSYETKNAKDKDYYDYTNCAIEVQKKVFDQKLDSSKLS